MVDQSNRNIYLFNCTSRFFQILLKQFHMSLYEYSHSSKPYRWSGSTWYYAGSYWNPTAFSQTWLSLGTSDLYSSCGYNYFRYVWSDKGGGGVSLFLKDNIMAERIQSLIDIMSPDSKTVFISAKIPNLHSRPPSLILGIDISASWLSLLPLLNFVEISGSFLEHLLSDYIRVIDY